jgi:hypothetical protein
MRREEGHKIKTRTLTPTTVVGRPGKRFLNLLFTEILKYNKISYNKGFETFVLGKYITFANKKYEGIHKALPGTYLEKSWQYFYAKWLNYEDLTDN